MVTETEFTIWGSVQSGSIARTSDFQYVKVETSSLYTLSLPPFNHPQQREHNWLILTTGGHFFFYNITTGGQTWYHYNSISWTIRYLVFFLHYCRPKNNGKIQWILHHFPTTSKNRKYFNQINLHKSTSL